MHTTFHSGHTYDNKHVVLARDKPSRWRLLDFEVISSPITCNKMLTVCLRFPFRQTASQVINLRYVMSSLTENFINSCML